MINNNNAEINEVLLSKSGVIRGFLDRYLAKSYKHIQRNGLVLSPMILNELDVTSSRRKIENVRAFFTKILKLLLENQIAQLSNIKKSVSQWGNADLVEKIYSTALSNGSINDFVEVGRLDQMHTMSSEINPACIDSLIDYKDLEDLMFGLWDELNIPVQGLRKQSSFLDAILDEMIIKTETQFPAAKYIGWISSYNRIYNDYAVREYRMWQYANEYLKNKGIALKFMLVPFENLGHYNLSDFGCLYDEIYPDELGTVDSAEVLKCILELSESNKLVSPYFVYPIEHKAIQALMWNDKFVADYQFSAAEVQSARDVFPRTLLCSELLEVRDWESITKAMNEYYIKSTYSWCGENVHRVGTLSDSVKNRIDKDVLINPYSWIVQEPADHIHVRHVQYQWLDEGIKELEMISDSGIQYVYNPSQGVKFMSISARNSVSHEEGIVSRSQDKIFRPAVVMIKG